MAGSAIGKGERDNMKKIVAFIVNMILMVNLALGMAASAETETGLAAERYSRALRRRPIVWAVCGGG